VRRRGLWLGLFLAISVFAQRGYRMRYDEDDIPVPADGNEKTEYVFARFRYPSMRGGYYGWGGWATDYPKADRQYLQGVRRLTRLHTRSMEEVVDLEGDKIYDYPWIYAVEVGRWGLNPRQAQKLRDYIDRGGFLMADDFHGPYEWEIFMDSLSRVFPDQPVVDMESSDPAFHVLYDLDKRFQIPGIHYIGTGVTYEKGGIEPKWRGVHDKKGRLVVAICHNMDLGDAWEWADHPRYPEPYASLAYRVGINYIIYSMTH